MYTPPICINVLSTFDGIATGYLSLQRAGFYVASYKASEISPYPIQIAQKNYPDIVQLGDVNDWQSWDLSGIDVFIGGPPCQGFSRAGKGLNFSDPRSALFFKYADILDAVKQQNPDVKFLCENVNMKKEWRDIISDRLGVKPIMVNSALVSAQNRERLYWANWSFPLPDDKGLLLKDVLLKDVLESGYLDRDKSYAIDYNYYKGTTLEQYLTKRRRQIVYEPNGTYTRGNLKRASKNGLIMLGLADNVKGLDTVRRVYSSDGKSPTLTTSNGGHRQPKVALDDIYYRKLTPVECERLQTLPDNYTEGVSNTRRYQVLGDGWTADILAHIFSYMYVPSSIERATLEIPIVLE